MRQHMSFLCNNIGMYDFITENFWFFPFGISLLVLIISMIREPRRFRNALLLMLVFLTGFIWALYLTRNTPYQFMIAFAMMLVTGFLVLIVPCLLIYDSFLMIRREGFSLGSLLAAIFALVIFGGEIALFVWLTSDFPDALNWKSVVLLMGGYAVFYISIVFLAFMFYSTGMRFTPRRVDFDYIIVLGCGLINGDQVGRLLGNRLDKAYKVFDRSMSACKIICSGGQGPDETVSEAEAMKKYLLENFDISPKDIILEDKSVNTMENLKNSQEIIKSRKGRQWTAIVSSGYHTMRAGIYAARIGLPAVCIGAHTALYYWPSAMIREYAALVKYYWRYYFTGLIVIGVLILLLVSKGFF